MYGKHILASVGAIAIIGCSSGSAPETLPAPSTVPASQQQIGWPVRSAEYVDLWMHGYALLTSDTAKVPLFEPGYRNRMLQIRRDRNVTTALDANRQTLQEGLAQYPNLSDGQFAVFSFNSWDELVRVVQLFVRNEGSPTTTNDQVTYALFVQLRNYFKTVADREWLRVFVMSLQEEQTKFYQSYWNAQMTDRSAARQAVESAWNSTYRNKFQRYLRNERLVDGSFILSLPLGGEGRSVLSQALGNGIAVPLEATADSATTSIYVFAHEVSGSAAARAIEDNLTPAEVRAGAAAKYTPIASVRAGAILLQRIAPELVQGYMRYYLGVAGAPAMAGDPTTSFNTTFSLPEPVAAGIAKQIDLVLAGI